MVHMWMKLKNDVTEMVARWTEKLAGGPQAGRFDSPLPESREWVDNNR